MSQKRLKKIWRDGGVHPSGKLPKVTIQDLMSPSIDGPGAVELRGDLMGALLFPTGNIKVIPDDGSEPIVFDAMAEPWCPPATGKFSESDCNIYLACISVVIAAMRAQASDPKRQPVARGLLGDLVEAVFDSDEKRVIELLNSNPELIDDTGTASGYTPLVYAVAVGSTDIVFDFLSSMGHIEVNRVFDAVDTVPVVQFTVEDIFLNGVVATSMDKEEQRALGLKFVTKCKECGSAPLTVFGTKRDGVFDEIYDSEKRILRTPEQM